MQTLTIDKTTARRYILGRQGLWPGRRWAGSAGVAAALDQIEAVQVDSIVVVARNHDIALWGRVADYDPADLERVLYTDRAGFDYGSILMIYPMRELPYWRPIMRRQAEENAYAAFVRDRPGLLDTVRATLRERGPLGNRDFEGTAVANNGRASKEPGLALNYLWSTGELMTHSRRKFERVYDFREAIAPPDLQHEATLEEAEAYFARKALRDTGICTARDWANRLAVTLHRRVPAAEARRTLGALVADGEAAPAQVAGSPDPWYYPAADADLLAALAAGQTPAAWQPLGPTTCDEVTLLAPLDNIIWERARTQTIFEFDYAWEVYKPAAQRRWGYYTLPILYGDRLVARLDPKLDRATGTLRLAGFWLDDPALEHDPAFATALARGLAHFARFLGARAIDRTALPPALAGVDAGL
jgi:uncharacterized protein YcaQ